MTESPDDKNTPKPKPARKNPKEAAKPIGVPFVLMCSAIATVLGMTGGAWLGSTFGPSKATGNVEAVSAVQAEFETLQSAIDQLKTRTAALETKQKGLMARKAPAGENAQSSDPAGLAEFGEDLMPLFEDIETRLAALEKQGQSVVIDKGDAKDDALSSPNEPTSSSTSTVAEAPTETGLQSSELDAKILALRKSIATLENRMTNQSKKFVTLNQLKSVRERVDAIETDFQKPPVLIPPFPRESVMDAMTGKTEKSGSWMSGLLGDEVRVVDADIVSRLDRIETLVEAGDIDDIKKEVSYLPEAAKPVIDSWLLQFDQGE